MGIQNMPLTALVFTLSMYHAASSSAAGYFLIMKEALSCWGALDL